ncbi:AraC family transcriptional regulator [Reinekea forsetii]|nr:AraC family transcriptional regulator [Reinekea forsetii]
MPLDRLSTLFRQAHFSIANPPLNLSAPMLVLSEAQSGHIEIRYQRSAQNSNNDPLAICIDFGGEQSALFQAIPDAIRMNLNPQHAAWAVAQTVLTELKTPRCGGPIMLERLVEVLMIYLLRDAIEFGAQQTGMLLGLADPQLKHALVAVHDSPDHPWTVDELAHQSGVSRTVFYKRFNEKVGCSPSHYLRQWRLTLARSQLLKGHRISQVAKSIGYQSNEGFSRAFHQHFGEWPSEVGE